jgi:taurine dioxygenase
MATANLELPRLEYRHIRVRPAAGNIGAFIEGVDLREPMGEEILAEIHHAFLDNHVIFFRDQDITPDQQKDFGRHFGELHIHPFIPALEGHPEIIELKSADTGPAEMTYQSNAWHTDLTYTAEPPLASILWCSVCPPAGGDTMFLNACRAYDTLSEKMKEMLEGLVAIHDLTVTMPPGFMNESWAPDQLKSIQKKTPPIGHPLVRTHPETGRKILFVNQHFTSHIEGLSRIESDGILNALYAHSQKPENIVRFSWEEKSLAMWDNRSTQHYAVNDYHSRRTMHRVTVCGDKPY